MNSDGKAQSKRNKFGKKCRWNSHKSWNQQQNKARSKK